MIGRGFVEVDWIEVSSKVSDIKSVEIKHKQFNVILRT
jgi:hypothetical protein